jgi:hypothetical protein
VCAAISGGIWVHDPCMNSRPRRRFPLGLDGLWVIGKGGTLGQQGAFTEHGTQLESNPVLTRADSAEVTDAAARSFLDEG